MKIDKDKQLQLLQNLSGTSSAKTKADASQTTTQGSADTGDKVELSGLKGQVASLQAKTKAIPAVDEDKVARIKQAIQSGTYNASGQMVARSMLKSQLQTRCSQHGKPGAGRSQQEGTRRIEGISGRPHGGEGIDHLLLP